METYEFFGTMAKHAEALIPLVRGLFVAVSGACFFVMIAAIRYLTKN